MSESTTQREKRELGQLLWFFWVGIGFVTVAESVFVILMKGGAAPASFPVTSLGVLGGIGGVLLALIVATNVTRFAGDGFATALICWMLAKAIAILGFAAFFLSHSFWAGAAFFAAFVAVMLFLWPGKFHH